MYPTLRLRPGKEATVIFRHPWVFSGALADNGERLENGELVHLADQDGRIIATGTFSARSQIAVRIFDFRECEINHGWLVMKIEAANNRRLLLGYGPGSETTGYRVVFGESDSIPGLVVDRYGDVFVIQISTAGTERLKAEIVESLVATFHPQAILERSDIPVRKEEGLASTTGVLYGQEISLVEFTEYGNRFVADVSSGQKTGFYFDQKELRRRLAHYSSGREVLNLFSNSGSFAVAAMRGGARRVHNVDSSQPVLDLISVQCRLNGIAAEMVTSECADVFAWLSPQVLPQWDMIILDPPALVKSQHDRDAGRKAYHFLNRAAMRLVRSGGILVTSSCSTFFPEPDFVHMLRRASVQAGVQLNLMESGRQSPDHPIPLYFPEASYLKSFICQVER